VTFTGAPAFCAVAGQTVHLPEWGPVTLDIAYGGNFYAIVDAAPFDLRLGTDTTGRAVELAHQIRNAVNATVDVVHPLIPGIRGVTHVQLFNQPKRADDPTPMMVVLPTGVVDRSPCGTGTTAKVATLLSRGQLDLDQPFVHQSITGARFTGRAVEAKTENGLSTCRVAITGSAYIVADSTVFLDTSDPLANGYELS